MNERSTHAAPVLAGAVLLLLGAAAELPPLAAGEAPVELAAGLLALGDEPGTLELDGVVLPCAMLANVVTSAVAAGLMIMTIPAVQCGPQKIFAPLFSPKNIYTDACGNKTHENRIGLQGVGSQCFVGT